MEYEDVLTQCNNDPLCPWYTVQTPVYGTVAPNGPEYVIVCYYSYEGCPAQDLQIVWHVYNPDYCCQHVGHSCNNIRLLHAGNM
jgi:hypothetical protein